MTQPPEGFVPVIGNIVGDGEVVPRGQSATSSTDPELRARLEALNPRRPFKRKIEATLDEAEIAGLNSFIRAHFKATGKRLTEEDAVRLLVVEGLERMGDLRLRR